MNRSIYDAVHADIKTQKHKKMNGVLRQAYCLLEVGVLSSREVDVVNGVAAGDEVAVSSNGNTGVVVIAPSGALVCVCAKPATPGL